MSTNQRLVALTRRPDLTAGQIATLLGVSRTTLRSWAKSSRPVDHYDAERVAAVSDLVQRRTIGVKPRRLSGADYDAIRHEVEQTFARSSLERIVGWCGGLSGAALVLGVERSRLAYWRRPETIIEPDVIERITRAERSIRVS